MKTNRNYCRNRLDILTSLHTALDSWLGGLVNLMLFYDGSKTIQPRIQVPAPWFGSFISDKTGAEAGVEYVGSQYSRILAPFQE